MEEKAGSLGERLSIDNVGTKILPGALKVREDGFLVALWFRAVFEPKLLGVPLQRDLTVEIPEFGKLEVPHAYRNGVLNLVRPEGFAIEEGSATAKANDLAVKGHLVYKHPGKQGKPQKQMIVGGFYDSATEDFKRRIGFVLREHDARLVPEEEIDDFVEEVRREPHA